MRRYTLCTVDSISHSFVEMLNREAKPRAILLASILSVGGTWRRKTTLWKAFWWAHLESMRTRGAELSSHQIVRLPHGPAPDDGERLLDCLCELDRVIKKDTDPERGGYPTEVFTITDKTAAEALVRQHLTDDELVPIRAAAERFVGMTAKAASDWSHEHSREWHERTNGEPMLIYRDLLTADEAARIHEKSAAGESELRRIFGQ